MCNNFISSKKNYSFLGVGMILLVVDLILFMFWEYFPSYQFLVYVGVLIWLTGIGLWVTGMLALKKYGDPTQNGIYPQTRKFVDKEIFQFVRHPQYLGYILFAVGFILITGDTWITLTSILSISFIYFGIQEEDENLLRLFGDDYKAYMELVPGINIVESIWRIYKKKMDINNLHGK